jgi:DNA-binding response OmpR family regulator
MKNILLIEDNKDQLDFWVMDLNFYGYENVVCTQTIDGAYKLLSNTEWDAVIIDGCIGGDEFNCPPLINILKTTVKSTCPIIAATRSPELAALMKQAGCTHVARTKNHATEILHSVLKHQ